MVNKASDRNPWLLRWDFLIPRLLNIFLFESSVNSAKTSHRKILKSKLRVVIIRSSVEFYVVDVKATGVSFKIEFK